MLDELDDELEPKTLDLASESLLLDDELLDELLHARSGDQALDMAQQARS